MSIRLFFLSQQSMRKIVGIINCIIKTNKRFPISVVLGKEEGK